MLWDFSMTAWIAWWAWAFPATVVLWSSETVLGDSRALAAVAKAVAWVWATPRSLVMPFCGLIGFPYREALGRCRGCHGVLCILRCFADQWWYLEEKSTVLVCRGLAGGHRALALGLGALEVAQHLGDVQSLVQLSLGHFAALHVAQGNDGLAYGGLVSHRVLGDLGCCLVANQLVHGGDS